MTDELKLFLRWEDLHLHSLIQVATLKTRLKLKGEVCLIDFISGALNRPPASTDTRGGEVGTFCG